MTSSQPLAPAPGRPAGPRRPRPSTGQAQLAGAVAAAVALGVGEIVTGLGGRGQSLVGSVGSAFVDQAGGGVARTAIRIFNTADKPALIVGIVGISLLIGAALGSASRRRPWVGPAGFAGFGVLGVLAAARDPLASTGLAATAALVAVAAGSATLWALLRVAAIGRLVAPPPDPDRGRAGGRRLDVPTDPYASRRAFFGYAGAAGAFAVVAGLGGRALRDRPSVVDTARAQIQLPPPTNAPAVPAGSPASLSAPGTAVVPDRRAEPLPRGQRRLLPHRHRPHGAPGGRRAPGGWG